MAKLSPLTLVNVTTLPYGFIDVMPRVSRWSTLSRAVVIGYE